MKITCIYMLCTWMSLDSYFDGINLEYPQIVYSVVFYQHFAILVSVHCVLQCLPTTFFGQPLVCIIA